MDPAVPVNPFRVPDPYRYYRVRFNGPSLFTNSPDTQTVDGITIGRGGPVIKQLRFYDVRGRLKVPVAVASQESGTSRAYSSTVPAGIRDALGPVSGQPWQMANGFDSVVFDFGVKVDIARIEVTQPLELVSYSASNLALKTDANVVITRCDVSNSPTFTNIPLNHVRRWSFGGSVLSNQVPKENDVVFTNSHLNGVAFNGNMERCFFNRLDDAAFSNVRNFYIKRSVYFVCVGRGTIPGMLISEIEATGLDAPLRESLGILNFETSYGTSDIYRYFDGNYSNSQGSKTISTGNPSSYLGIDNDARLNNNIQFCIVANDLTEIKVYTRQTFVSELETQIVVFKTTDGGNSYTKVYDEPVTWNAGDDSHTITLI